MKLVADAHRWWRWHSTYVFAVLALFPAVWLSSADLQALLPPKLVSAIAPAVGVIGFVVRLRKQAESLPPVKEEPKDDNHQ